MATGRVRGSRCRAWGRVIVITAGLLLAAAITGCTLMNETGSKLPAAADRSISPTPRFEVALPPPGASGTVSVEEALAKRRSLRSYSPDPLTLQEISNLLWAAQGITDPAGFRTAPSAGGLYPLETYLVLGRVESLQAGVYHYLPAEHKLARTAEGDLRTDVAAAAVEQEWIKTAPAIIVFSAVYERTTVKYGERGLRYVHMEAGHAAQNVCLEAVALGLGTTTVGAFQDDRIRQLLNMPDDASPLYILPVGRPAAPGG